MTAPTIDHTALAESRIATQYKASQKFLATIRALMQQTQAIETLLFEVATITDIDASSGVQLDIIGEIVGISRYVKNALPVAFFGFNGQPETRSYGEEGLPDFGGKFREDDQPTTMTQRADDAQYRLFLRARIARNHTKGTVESVMQALQYVFDTEAVIINDKNDMSFDVSIGRRLTFSQQVLLYLLEIIPKPAGVRINTRSYFDSTKVFGFEGYAYAQGFGDDNEFSVTTLPRVLDGSKYLDGSWALDGIGDSVRTYTPPLSGGLFAEEFTIDV